MGGIVVMRIGSNALQVIAAVKQQIATLQLPDGVQLVPTYDRSDLIVGSIATLKDTLFQQALIVTIICLVFLFHARSALVVMCVLPLSVLFSFIAIRYLGLSSNIMSLGGIAIAIGELADAAIVLIENAHVRLAAAEPGADRKQIIIEACKEVGRPIFFSLLLITVSFLPTVRRARYERGSRRQRRREPRNEGRRTRRGLRDPVLAPRHWRHGPVVRGATVAVRPGREVEQRR